MSRWSWMGSCLVVCLAACGDGEEEPAVLDPQEALDDLSGAENDLLCERLNRLVEADPEYHELYCTTQGVIAATQGLDMCEDAHDACLTAEAALCQPGDDPEPLGCPKLTVDMYLDCFQQMQDRAKIAQAEVTCDSSLDDIIDRGEDSLDDLKAHPTGPCKKMFEVCPTFLD